MNATDAAYEALKSAVLNGELLPLESLNETYFCERLSISRTPLRSAIGRLTAEGWFQTSPNRAVRVAGVSEREIAELYAARSLLEAATVELAAKNCTDADISQLRYMLSMQKLAADADNEAEVSRLGQQLHEMIWRIADNGIYLGFLSVLQERMTRYRRLSASQPGRTVEATEEHALIVEALAARDAEAASRHLARHIDQGKVLSLAAFRQWQRSAEKAKASAKPARRARQMNWGPGRS